MHGNDKGHPCGARGVTVVWHLLFLESVSRGANRTKEKSKSRGDKKEGERGLVGGGVEGGGGGADSRLGEKGDQGAEHKASQIDLSLHQESLARPQHYHTHHTLLEDRVLQPTSILQQCICIINNSYSYAIQITLCFLLCRTLCK